MIIMIVILSTVNLLACTLVTMLLFYNADDRAAVDGRATK